MRQCWPRINKESCTTPRSKDRGESFSHHLYEASTPTRRCAVGWAGWGWARMIHPDPDAAHARMRGPTPHEISEPPPFPSPHSRAPLAPPRTLGLAPLATVSSQLLPLQASARLGMAASSTRACAARTVARSKTSAPPSAPAPPAPLGGRGRSTFIPRSVPSGHAVEIPCLDRGLTAPHSTAQPAPPPSLTARTRPPTEESFFDERC